MYTERTNKTINATEETQCQSAELVFATNKLLFAAEAEQQKLILNTKRALNDCLERFRLQQEELVSFTRLQMIWMMLLSAGSITLFAVLTAIFQM